jgi:hypothetical protein
MLKKDMPDELKGTVFLKEIEWGSWDHKLA